MQKTKTHNLISLKLVTRHSYASSAVRRQQLSPFPSPHINQLNVAFVLPPLPCGEPGYFSILDSVHCASAQILVMALCTYYTGTGVWDCVGTYTMENVQWLLY